MDFDNLCAKYADLIEIEEMVYDIGECDIAKLFNKIKSAMKKYNIHASYYQRMIDHACREYPENVYQYWTLFQLIRYEFDYLIQSVFVESNLKKAYYREYHIIRAVQSDEIQIPTFSECFDYFPKSGIIRSIIDDNSEIIKKFIETNASEEEEWDELDDYKLIDWCARYGSEKCYEEFCKVCEPSNDTLNFAIIGRHPNIYQKLLNHIDIFSIEKIIISHNFKLFLQLLNDHKIDFDGIIQFCAKNYNLKMFFYALCHSKEKTNAFKYFGYIQIPEIYEYFCQMQKPTNPDLLTAAEQSNNVSLVKILLENGMKFDASDLDINGHISMSIIVPDSIDVYKYVFHYFNKSDLPVHFIYCAINGSFKIANYLLKEYNVDVNYVYNNDTALCVAARSSCFWFINFLIENGADANKCSPLINAVSCGNVYETKLLLKYGADINRKDERKQETPLHHAARRGEIRLLEAVMEYNPDLEATDCNGDTPLITSIRNSYFKRHDVVSNLVDKGCNIHAKNNEGKTSLHYTCQYEMYESTMLLFNKGADPNAQDNELNTPIHIAIMNKQTKAAAFLVKHGGNPNLANAKGETPTSLSLTMKFPNLHKFFLQYGGKDN